MSSLHEGTGRRGEGRAGCGEETGKRKGGENQLDAQLIFRLTEVRGEGNYSVHEDNLIQLSQQQPRKSAIYGSFLLANSLYTKRKKSNMQEMQREMQTRENKPAQQSCLGLLGWLSLFSFQGTVRPPLC